MSNFFSNNNNETNNLFKGAGSTFGQNIFSDSNDEKKSETPKDNSLQGQYKEIKDNYEQIFMEAVESIRKELDTFKPEKPCEGCSHKDCKITKKDIFAPYPTSGCKLREWQMKAVTYLTGDYKQKLKHVYKSIMDKRSEYQCNKCGSCCKLAVSEHSYTQLKQRAMKGDKYSEEFVSVSL